MHTVVVNRISLTVPAEELLPDLERETPALLKTLGGFIGQTLVQTGPQEVVMIARWTSPEAAAAGAAVVGPGVFHRLVAPRVASQDRMMGQVVLDIGWDR